MKGLVLAGGYSTRMGRDKGAVVYTSLSPRPSAERLHATLRPLCSRVYVSLRPDQAGFPGVPRLDDSRPGAGPAAGLLAAHAAHPESPWLVVACDFPFADKLAASALLSRRDPEAPATCFLGTDGRPEPLFAIWEARALRELAADVARGSASPRATLERLGCHVLRAPHSAAIANVNSPEDARLHGLL